MDLLRNIGKGISFVGGFVIVLVLVMSAILGPMFIHPLLGIPGAILSLGTVLGTLHWWLEKSS